MSSVRGGEVVSISARSAAPAVATSLVGVVGAAAAMAFAGLPEGPSLLPFVVALVLMTTLTGLVVGALRAKDARNTMVGLLIGQIVGAMAVVIASLFPGSPSIEDVLGVLSLGGAAFGAIPVLVGLVFGPVSVRAGAAVGDRLLLRRQGKR